MDHAWSERRLPAASSRSRWAVIFGVGALALVMMSAGLGWTYAALANHPAMKPETVIVHERSCLEPVDGQAAAFACDEVLQPEIARAIAE